MKFLGVVALGQRPVDFIFGLICILEPYLYVHRIFQKVIDRFEPNYM